nr:unnamed protein product [Digitaria exilis]
MGSVAMDSDYGAPRELSPLQKARALYQPELPPCLQFATPLPVPVIPPLWIRVAAVHAGFPPPPCMSGLCAG